MNYNYLVDSVAAIAKIGIENSNLTRNEKERDKQWVDYCKDFLKDFISSHQTQQSVLGIDINRIAFIAKTACNCKMEKVVLIPVPDSVGNMHPLIKCYGNNTDCFFQKINVHSLSPKTVQQEADLITECERTSGIIIYERKQQSEAPL